MKLRRIYSAILVALLLFAAPSFADSLLDGHWEGKIEVPGGLEINLDFHSDAAGAITGDISIPVQQLSDRALTGIAIEDNKARFEIADIPGDPSFEGTLSEDGSKLAGKFTQGGASFDFQLERGESRADRARSSLEGFADFANKAVEDWNVPGTAIAVVVEDEVVLAEGFGYRDLENQLPMTQDSLFAIGSTSKAFTTTLLGMLVDDGELEWDKPLRDYLPRFRLADPLASELMTPRDLVTHRSGLPRHDLLWYNNNESTRADLVAALAHVEATADFRQKFQYNNLMFLTAGYLAEQITGKTWEELVRERILEPLGMERTTFDINDSQEDANFAQPHRETDEQELEKIPFRDISLIGPAGSINSSVHEMSRWLRFNLRGGTVDEERLIQADTLADIHSPHMAIPTPPSRPEISSAAYGLGWMVDTYRGHRRVTHGGGIDGFITSVMLFPDDQLGIVAFTNTGSGLPSLLAQHAADRALGLEPIDWTGEALELRKKGLEAQEEVEAKKSTNRRNGTQPSHPLEEYPGEYLHPGYGELRVTADGDQLSVTYNGITAPLEHWHFDVWSGAETEGDPTFEDLRLQFGSDLDGNIAQIRAPLEPSVEPIVFYKKAPARLSDPVFLARLLGRYQLAAQTVEISFSGETTLRARISGQPAYDLVPKLGNRFQLKQVKIITMGFELPEDGPATKIIFFQPDGVYEAERIEEEDE